MNSETSAPVSLRRHLSAWANRLRGREDPNLRAARQHRSFDAMSGILAWMLSYAGDRVPRPGASRGRALEIGTGQFMAHAAGLHVCGYERVLTIDRYRQVSIPLVRASMESPVLSRRLLSPFVNHDDFVGRLGRLEATGYDPSGLARVGVEYRAPMEAVALLEQPERFDLVFSYTVLEHVPPQEIAGLLSASARLLAPGGVALHFVDMEDHRDPRTAPFAFLAPGEAWGEAACGERGNRLRASEWRRLFREETPLDWSFPYAPVRHGAPLPEQIDPRVKAVDVLDLRTTALVAMAIAPDSPQ